MQPYPDDATQVSTETSCQISKPVLLVGNGRVDPDLIRAARSCEHTLVAADGGADRLLALGMVPDLIVGDLDSLRDRGAFPSTTRILYDPDQDSPDLQKCLRVIDAPFFLCTGFVGSRYDHSLSLPHVFLAETKRTFVFVERKSHRNFTIPRSQAAAMSLASNAEPRPMP